jgi:hypothetical protein
MGTLKERIQYEVHFEPKSQEMILVWQVKLKVKIWLLEGWILTTIERTMFPLLTSLNIQGWHLNKWMK